MAVTASLSTEACLPTLFPGQNGYRCQNSSLRLRAIRPLFGGNKRRNFKGLITIQADGPPFALTNLNRANMARTRGQLARLSYRCLANGLGDPDTEREKK
jgi:hypothetical protein